MEIWRPVYGFEKFYEVSNYGRVRSFHRGNGCIRRLGKDADGYYQLDLYKGEMEAHKRVVYNEWPLGSIPKELQRTEPEDIKALGYRWNDPREIVDMFERKVADFAGSKYAVAVDCCTHAMELSLRYLLHIGEISMGDVISIPEQTYVSAALIIEQLGFGLSFRKEEWSGVYQLGSTRVLDGAVRWSKEMYEPDSERLWLHCLSFQIKKRISIGRGGMVLTDDPEAAEWLKLAAYDGRDLTTPYTDPNHLKMHGWHYYMTPEDAARGILLMDAIHEEGDSGCWQNYPNVKQMLKL